MAIEITVPRLGWSMDEGAFVEWLKNDGDFVAGGDMLFVLEGEKASQEIESFDSGTLCIPADAPRPGATVQVGEVIAFLLADGEPAPTSVHIHSSPPTSSQRQASSTTRPEPVSTTAHVTQRAAGPATRRLARELGLDLNAVDTPDPTGRVICEDLRRATAHCNQSPSSFSRAQRSVATPRARRLARELGVDWTRLRGTGRNGRIRERDVLATPTEGTASQPPTAEFLPTEPGRFSPATKLRQSIAERMSAGFHQAAPVTLTTKINAEALITHREHLKPDATNGLAPSFNDILIYQAARTLREFPELNACWHRNGVHVYDAVHIATAIDTSAGLLAPVVRNADELTVGEIAEQTRRLIAQARAGELSQKQLSGGGFTISNLGMFGVDAFTPILNLPQAAILGVGRIVTEPVVRDGQLVIGKTLTLSLTFDHRVLDGAPAARWLQRLGERLQDEAIAGQT